MKVREKVKVTLINSEEGIATLILVIVVMVVSLGVGATISYKSSSAIKQSARTVQADQARNCAETGAEAGIWYVSNTDPVDLLFEEDKVLYSNSEPPSPICSYNFKLRVAEAFVDPDYVYKLDTAIPADDVFQVNLVDYNGPLKIVWGDLDSAAVEIALIKGTSAPYSVEKYAYYGDLSNAPNGFEAALSTNSYQGYSKSSEEFNITGDYQIARVRPLLESTHLMAVFGNEPPLQGYIVSSEGTAGEIKNVIEVTVSLPQMSSMFDYVLFSEGAITK